MRFVLLSTLMALSLIAQMDTCEDANDHYRFDASNRGPAGPPFAGPPFNSAPSPGGCEIALLERWRASTAQLPGNPVSLHRLTHKPAKPARKQASQAAKALRAGKTAEVLEHWRRATEFDPVWVEAHNNYGVHLYAAGRYDQAAREFEQAASLDPMSPEICANAGIAMAAANAMPAAEYWSRRAIRLDPASAKAQYVRAFVLVRTGRDTAEALRLLASSVETFPSARPLYEYLTRAASR